MICATYVKNVDWNVIVGVQILDNDRRLSQIDDPRSKDKDLINIKSVSGGGQTEDKKGCCGD